MLLSHALRTASQKSRSIEYITTANSTANLTTYTFSNVSLGTVTSNRLVVIGVYGHNTTNRTISGVTVGGVSATLVGKYDGFSSNNGIYQIANASDSIADIVVTFSGGELRAAINVWALYNLSSTTSEDYDFGFTSSSNSISRTLTGTSGGLLVAQGSINTTLGTASWTGATENNEVTLEAAVEYSAATNSNSSSSQTITIDWANTTSKSLVAARWY
jgi:hypothetical protein